MNKLFSFDTMITPQIITFVYWLLLLIVLFSGLANIFRGNFLYGLGIILIGAISARIWCELLIVLFKINENIQKLSEK